MRENIGLKELPEVLGFLVLLAMPFIIIWILIVRFFKLNIINVGYGAILIYFTLVAITLISGKEN